MRIWDCDTVILAELADTDQVLVHAGETITEDSLARVAAEGHPIVGLRPGTARLVSGGKFKALGGAQAVRDFTGAIPTREVEYVIDMGWMSLELAAEPVPEPEPVPAPAQAPPAAPAPQSGLSLLEQLRALTSGS
jgi:hypothetical protein